MITRKDIEEALDTADINASEKQINALAQMSKRSKKGESEIIKYIENAENIQSVFDYLTTEAGAPAVSDYVDLRNYPNIPSNAKNQWDSESKGFWFLLTNKYWVFVKEKNLSQFFAKWTSEGEIEIKPVKNSQGVKI